MNSKVSIGQISIFDILDQKKDQKQNTHTHMITFKKLKASDKKKILKDLEETIKEYDGYGGIDFILSGTAFEASPKNGAYIDFGTIHKDSVLVDGKLEHGIVEHSHLIRFNEPAQPDGHGPNLEDMDINQLKEKIEHIAQFRTNQWMIRERLK